MPMLSRDLEDAVRRSVTEAARRRHELATLEHLLHAIAGSGSGAELLGACGVDRARLRADLERSMDAVPPAAGPGVEPRPAAEYSRAMQGAAAKRQSAGRDKVRCADVLVAMFAERESAVPSLLEAHGVSPSEIVALSADRESEPRPPGGGRPVRR